MQLGVPVNTDTLNSMNAPSHIAFFYDGMEEWLQVVLYAVGACLLRGERCVCIVGPEDQTRLRSFIDYKYRETEWKSLNNQLTILSSEQFLERGGKTDVEGLVDAIIAEVQESLSIGFNGLFLLMNMDAILPGEDREQAIMSFDRVFNRQIAIYPCITLGAYDYRQYSITLLEKILGLREQFIQNLRLYSNPHYNNNDPGPARTEEWLNGVVQALEEEHDSELWQKVINHSFHSLALYTFDGRLVQCNPAFCSLLGFTMERLRGLSLEHVLSVSDNPFQGKLRAGECSHFCMENFSASDGRSLTLEILIHVLADCSGQLYYALSLANISEKQRLAEGLQEREEEFQALLESINDTVFILDRNERYTGIYGHGIFDEDLNPNVFLGKTAHEIFVEPKAETFTEANRRALSGDKVTYEYTLGSHGSERSYQTALAPIRNKDDEITGLVGISRNITELKNAQEELLKNYEEIKAMNQDLEFYQNRLIKKNDQLRESQQRLELALWGAGEAFWDWDLQAETIAVDNRWVDNLNLHQLPEKEGVFQNREWIQLTHPDDLACLRQKSIDCLKGLTSNFEVEFRIQSEESWIWVLVRGSVVNRDHNGRALRLVGTYQDITEKKLAITALAESEQRYQRLFEQSPIGLVRFDTQGVISDANTRFLELMQFHDREDLKTFNLFTSPEAIEAGLEKLVRDSLTNQNTGQGELLFQIPGNKKIWLHYNIDPVVDKNGLLMETIMACEDYTERKNNEMKIMYLSFHDRLTGLYNRAFFEEELKRIDVERQLPLSIAMGDINGLKLVNDAFGHQEGDRLLKRIAELLKVSCREEDIIARWGGDEFIVLLPQTDNKTAAGICERIKKNASASEPDPIALSIALGFATKDHLDQDIMGTLKKAENDMYLNKLLESKNTRNSIIASLENTLWERTIETREHIERMQRIALRMAASMGLRKNDADKLMLLAKLHDIGKIGIPNEVLEKPGRLLADEWDTVKKHSEIGYRIVNASPELAVIAEEILSHHENWNGRGYPRGLKGDEIPQLARIIAIIDAYDVMTHLTPYKNPVSHEQALQEIQEKSGAQFDPRLVELFLYNFS
ncbi:MAG TPA: PAS domain S-box protein [Syntrophomonadaceae bacterium]|nr:PAS domain S-box protein [Syntrophomonadaceae bacterium]